jgi:hypothetical protein
VGGACAHQSTHQAGFTKNLKSSFADLSPNFVRPNLSFGSQKILGQKSVLKLRQVATCLKPAGEDLNMAARIRINFAATEYLRQRGPDRIIADKLNPLERYSAISVNARYRFEP